MQLNQHTGLQFSFVFTGAVGAVDLSIYCVTQPKYCNIDMHLGVIQTECITDI